MLLRVAALLGMTVQRLVTEMSADEFMEWVAFYSIEPWGYDMANWRMGVVAATTANYSGRLKQQKKPADFMPRSKSTAKRKQSTMDMKLALSRADNRNG